MDVIKHHVYLLYAKITLQKRDDKLANINISNNSNIKNNKKINLSLFFGIFSIITSFVYIGLICGIIGLIYGFLAFKKINHLKLNGKRKVIISIICCFLGIFLTFLSSVVTGMTYLN